MGTSAGVLVRNERAVVGVLVGALLVVGTVAALDDPFDDVERPIPYEFDQDVPDDFDIEPPPDLYDPTIPDFEIPQPPEAPPPPDFDFEEPPPIDVPVPEYDF